MNFFTLLLAVFHNIMISSVNVYIHAVCVVVLEWLYKDVDTLVC